ncbi:MAG: efflux RND transporter periplasmic adaptor subunit [Synergistaceae bacterium]|nr:efflux RND transporter periplasmic adaptor subunit [Synergistaceae bacterium]
MNKSTKKVVLEELRRNIPGRNVRIILAVSLLLLVFIGLYSRREKISSFFDKNNNKDQTAYVKVETIVSNKTIQLSIVQNMSIEAVNRVNLLPRVTGRLDKLHVKRGDSVKTGQILATLEHTQQNAQIEAAVANLASSVADAERAKAEMMNAKTNLDRYERLVKEGFSTQQQYDSIATTYFSAKANYNASLAKQRQLSSELNRTRSTRGDYIITSPLNGIVLNDYSLAPGAMISPSTPVMDIADLTQLKATLKIPESKIFIVQEGMFVTLTFDALPKKEFKAKVTKIDQYVDPDTRTSNVEIALNNKDTEMILRPGMFGQASIIEEEKKNAIVVPESAIHERENDFYVWVVINDKAVLRTVKTGIKQNSDVQITEGLKPGEKVIIFGGNNLKNGDSVKIQNQ